MAECWIVNSSPLISLDRIGLLDILGRLGREVVIPRGVLDEIARGPAPIAPSRLAIHRTVVIDHFGFLTTTPLLNQHVPVKSIRSTF